MKVRGTEMPNHRAKMATSVPKGMAAEEPSTHRIRFIRKKSANTILRWGGCVGTEGTEREMDQMSEVDLHVVCQLRCWLCLGEKLAWRQAYPGHSSAVNRTLVFHFSPPNAEGTRERKWTSEDTGDDSNLLRLNDPVFRDSH